jgi:hypothetical protein
MTQIVIDLGEVWADEQTVAEAILERAVTSLFGRYELQKAVEKRVAEMAEEQIREAVAPLVAKALERPYQPTNAYGDRVGEPTELREVIVTRVESELKQSRADSGGFSSSRRETLLDEIIGRQLGKVVGEDLRQAMDAARKKVREAVEAKGAEVLAETIARMAR